MKKYIFFTLISIATISGSALKAQVFFRATEYGAMAGGAQYFGDLNEEYSFQTTSPAGGVFFRYHVNPFIALKVTASYTQLSFDDKLSSNPFNQRRNLNFKTDLLEGSLQAEFNFFRFATGEYGKRFTPYLTGGIGAFYFNPYTTYGGRKYFLRNIGTEGQLVGFNDRKYETLAICFPIGAGIKYWIRPGMNFGFEIANRLTLTDYLDDVSTTYIGANRFTNDPANPNPAYYLQDRSIELNNAEPLGREGKQRGNDATKDQYMYFVLKLSFQLKTYKCPDYMKAAPEF